MKKFCVVCEKELVGQRQKFCGDDCTQAHFQEIQNIKRRAKVGVRIVKCKYVECDNDVEIVGTFNRSYCSKPCGLKQNNLDNLAKARERSAKKRANKRICPVCEKQFTLAKYKTRQKFCGAACKQKAKDSGKVYKRVRVGAKIVPKKVIDTKWLVRGNVTTNQVMTQFEG